MMSSKPLSRKYVEEYDSDDGFVEDAPKSKKLKKTEGKPLNATMQKDEDGSEYWELSGKRRVQVTQFKGNTMVGVREFYEKDGKALPGKKGISMTVEQYSAFLQLVPDIERVLESRGITIPRPPYDKEAKADPDDDGEEDEGVQGVGEEEGDEGEEKPPVKHKGKLDRFKMKRNHEATSDEDE